MIQVTIAEPRDYAGVLRLWAAALPLDWIGTHRFYTGLLCDPLFAPDSLWVAKDGHHIAGFLLVSACVNGVRKLGAMAVDAQYRMRGVGTLLWGALSDTAQLCDRILLDGIFPYVFIPGVDRAAYAAAWQWFLHQGCHPSIPVVAMARSLEDVRILATVSRPVKLDPGTYLGILPKHLRAQSLAIARSFGAGWERALRETWLQDHHPDRVIGLYTREKIWGLSVVGGYGEPLGRLGPIGVIAEARGHGWGGSLLHYTLQYMRTYHVDTAYFLHCTEGIPAYHMYRKQGFSVTRTFVPMVKYLVSV